MLLCQEAVNCNILHTAVRELTLQVPAGASVLTVFGPNLQDWRAEAGGKLSVILKNEVMGSYVLRVTYGAAQPGLGRDARHSRHGRGARARLRGRGSGVQRWRSLPHHVAALGARP